MLASRVRVHAFTAPRAICHISNSNIWAHIYGWNYSSDQPKKEFGENRNFFRCSSCARRQNQGSPRHRPSRGGIWYVPRKFTSIALQYYTSKPPGRGPKTRGGGLPETANQSSLALLIDLSNFQIQYMYNQFINSYWIAGSRCMPVHGRAHRCQLLQHNWSLLWPHTLPWDLSGRLVRSISWVILWNFIIIPATDRTVP